MAGDWLVGERGERFASAAYRQEYFTWTVFRNGNRHPPGLPGQIPGARGVIAVRAFSAIGHFPPAFCFSGVYWYSTVWAGKNILDAGNVLGVC